MIGCTRKQRVRKSAETGRSSEVESTWEMDGVAMPRISALMCGTLYHKNSNSIRYRLCTEKSILSRKNQERATNTMLLNGRKRTSDQLLNPRKNQIHNTDRGWRNV
jgi:hypothetical protein